MSFWNPDKECDRPTTSEYYDQQNRANRLRKAIDEAIKYANWRWMEWGTRAQEAFNILLRAQEEDNK